MQRHLLKNLPTCPNYRGKILVGKNEVNLGREIVFKDTLNHILIPDFKGDCEVMGLTGWREDFSFGSHKGDSIPINPIMFKRSDGIQIKLKSNSSTCERIYLPYRFENQRE